jgi:hypothetical protein
MLALSVALRSGRSATPRSTPAIAVESGGRPSHDKSGRNRARTCDLFLVREALSQLSYSPVAHRMSVPRSAVGVKGGRNQSTEGAVIDIWWRQDRRNASLGRVIEHPKLGRVRCRCKSAPGAIGGSRRMTVARDRSADLEMRNGRASDQNQLSCVFRSHLPRRVPLGTITGT